MDEEEIHPATRLSPRLTPEITPAKTPENRKPFTDTDRLELITAVKEYPFLYNTKNAWFDENPKRQIAWREIGMMIEQPAKTCKMCWRNLVHSFKAYRKRKMEEPALSPWQFDTTMDFITPYIDIQEPPRPEPTISGFVDLVDDDLDEEKTIEIADSPMNEEMEIDAEQQHVNTCKVEVEVTTNGTEEQTITTKPVGKVKTVLSGSGGFFSLCDAPDIIFDAPELQFDDLSPEREDDNRKEEQQSVDNRIVKESATKDKSQHNNIVQCKISDCISLAKQSVGNTTLSPLSPTGSLDLDDPIPYDSPDSPESDEDKREEGQNIDTRKGEKQTINSTQQNMVPHIKTEPVIENSQESYTFALNDDNTSTPVIIFDHPELNFDDLRLEKEVETSKNGKQRSKELEFGTAPVPAVKDDIDLFFSIMASTVKTFSPLNRTMAKSRIFTIITEIEMEHIQQNQLET